MSVNKLWILGVALALGTLLSWITLSDSSPGQTVPDDVACLMLGGACESEPDSFECYDDGYILDCDAETCHTLAYDFNGDSRYADDHTAADAHACGGGYFYSCGSCHNEDEIVDCS